MTFKGNWAGQSGLVQVQLLLTQHPLAFAAMVAWRCSIFHWSGRSNWPTAWDLKTILSLHGGGTYMSLGKYALI